MLGKFIDGDFIQKPVKCESMTENYPEFLVASLNYYLFQHNTPIRGSILSPKMFAWATKFHFWRPNLNLVASVTTSIIEAGDQKFWIIFRH
jgi:hypothetical protein